MDLTLENWKDYMSEVFGHSSWACTEDKCMCSTGDIIEDIRPIIESLLSLQRQATIAESARIVRDHSLQDWSGEEEVYKELEDIAKNIESQYSPSEDTVKDSK